MKSLLSILLLSVTAIAQGTKTWEQSSFDDFEKGTGKGVAIRSDGALELAPAFKPLITTPSTYIWSMVSDDAGNVYAAAGSPARVYRIAPDGSASIIFEPKELQVQAVLTAKDGAIYAATSPDGKVYRIEHSQASTKKPAESKPVKAADEVKPVEMVADPSYTSSIYFDPKTKYIWDLALDVHGNLYAASGEKRNSAPASGSIVQVTPVAPPINPAMAPIGGAPALGSSPFVGAPNFAAANAGNSEVYQIAPDGSPRRLWASRDDLVYALAFDKEHHLLAGSGNKGRIFAISADASGDYTDLLKGSANQITGFAKAPNGNLYASSSNLGKIFVISSGPEREGIYDSHVFDARNFSRWGKAEVRGEGAYELYARSGNVDNPDRNWSPWKKIDLAGKDPGNLDAPPARFVQWRTVLHPAGGRGTSRIDTVVLNYRPKNVAPAIDEVVVQLGTRFTSAPKQVTGIVTNSTDNSTGPRFEAPPAPVKDSGAIGVRWSAHDDNDDDLVYTLFYRGDNESTWKPLGSREKITDRAYSFDNGLLPDGGYVIKVVASDAPAHSPEESLSANKESARFEVDNTPPAIADLNAALEAEPASTDATKKNPVRRKDDS